LAYGKSHMVYMKEQYIIFSWESQPRRGSEELRYPCPSRLLAGRSPN